MDEFCFRLSPKLEQAARRIEATSDYKVLRRLPQIDEIWVTSPADDPVRIAVLDSETTGLNPDFDDMIELAVTVVTVNANGSLHDIEETRSWLEQPREALTEEISRITGLTDDDLRGQWFDEEAIAAVLKSCDILVSHNARFDRSFLASRFPDLADRPWACTLNDIDWSESGLSGRALPHLLAEVGYFYSAHRAAPDSWALACLLSLRASDGRTYAAHLVDVVRTPTVRIFATRAPFETKNCLKARGYRWCAERRQWWTDVALDADHAEREWLASVSRLIAPMTLRVTAYERHL